MGQAAHLHLAVSLTISQCSVLSRWVHPGVFLRDAVGGWPMGVGDGPRSRRPLGRGSLRVPPAISTTDVSSHRIMEQFVVNTGKDLGAGLLILR